MKNYLTIDVEDYFHVAAFDQVINIDDWQNYSSRVVQNTRNILDILEQHNTKGTFFILGWVAEQFPDLVVEIEKAGHEIGCHSYLHRKVYTLQPHEFRKDTAKAKRIIEDIVGHPIQGYRAPSYSITKNSLWALDILEELGFTYDSSIFPIHHDNYGIPEAERFEHQLPGNRLKEYPISTIRILGKNIPVSGGGYFRLFPYWFSQKSLQRINTKEKRPFMFYLHPWEVDPSQPRIQNAGMRSKFRHYNNLDKTASRLQRLLTDFHFGPISDQTPVK